LLGLNFKIKREKFKKGKGCFDILENKIKRKKEIIGY